MLWIKYFFCVCIYLKASVLYRSQIDLKCSQQNDKVAILNLSVIWICSREGIISCSFVSADHVPLFFFDSHMDSAGWTNPDSDSASSPTSSRSAWWPKPDSCGSSEWPAGAAATTAIPTGIVGMPKKEKKHIQDTLMKSTKKWTKSNFSII